MQTGRLDRLLPLSGALFGVLMVIGSIAAGSPADTTDSADKLVDHYKDGKLFIGVICLGLGAVVFLFFAAAMRKYLMATGPETPSVLFFGAAVVFVVGLSQFATSQFSLLNAADDKNAGVMQALNYIDNNNFPPTVIGLCVLTLALAWHVLSSGSLPKWLGWLALALGVLSLLGPIGILAFLLFVPFTFIVSIAAYQRSSRAA